MDAITQAETEIERIDQEIDANRRVLLQRVRFAPSTAAEFQAAWDRNPDLWARERGLFRRRGYAQQRRDAAIERAWQTEQRRLRASRRRAAKICGSSTLGSATAFQAARGGFDSHGPLRVSLRDNGSDVSLTSQGAQARVKCVRASVTSLGANSTVTP